MTTRPIIFSAPMVRALLAGRKTQTRRLATSPLRRCEPGDLLYVRENWRVGAKHDATKAGQLAPRNMTVLFAAGGSIANLDGDWLPGGGYPEGAAPSWAGKLRPSIFLPRWASRLTLAVEAVRVEPLQAISDDDAIAEGITFVDSVECADGISRPMWFGVPHCGQQAMPGAPRQAYFDLWDSLHNPRGLCPEDNPEGSEANPDVLVLTFRVIHGNVDGVAHA